MDSQEKDSSRFAHISKIEHSSNGSENSMDTQDGDVSANETMVISAGIKFQTQETTGSFVTAVVNGHDKPRQGEATIIRPTTAANGGQEKVKTYKNWNQGLQENGQIGSVSFNEGKAVTNGLIKGKSHQQNPVTFPLLNPLKDFEIKVCVHSSSRPYRQFMVPVTSTYTVDQLKKHIKDEYGLEPDQQNLVFAGRNLACGMTLGHYGLKQGDEILLTCRLRGG